MSRRRDSMKYQISQSFKLLLLEYPFENITVKLIAERAGIIRSTFYHHFRDKLDVLDWIIQEELIKPTKIIFQKHQIREGLAWMLNQIVNDLDFYHRAIRISGKNGFEEVIYYHIGELFWEEIQRHGVDGVPNYSLLDADMLAKYYAYCFVHAITQMVTKKMEYSLEEMLRSYEYLASHSLMDILSASGSV